MAKVVLCDVNEFFFEVGNKIPDNLKQLSRDLYEMYSKKQNTDISLYSMDYQKFRCHKTILAARSPTLSRILDILGNTTLSFGIEGLERRIMMALLSYIYSGDLRLIAFQEVPYLDLYAAAHNYELFAMKEFLIPQILPDKEPVSKKKILFKWKIEGIESSGLFAEREWISPRPKTIKIGSDKFHIKIKVYGTVPEEGFLDVFLQRETNRKVIHQVSLDVTILDNSKRRNFHRRLDYIFKRDFQCALSGYVKKEMIAAKKHIFLTNDSLTFSFDFCVQFYDFDSDSLDSGRFRITDRIKCSNALIKGYQVLSNDLLRLFHHKIYQDLILFTDWGSLTAHKCILAARSLTEIFVLEKVFVKLKFEEAESVLLFLYSGNTKYLKDHAEIVHKIASDLKLDKLKGFYSDYLSKTFTVDNVLGRLLCADSNDDINLMQNALNFISFHRVEILSSNRWIKFEEICQDLATEVHNCIGYEQTNVNHP